MLVEALPVHKEAAEVPDVSVRELLDMLDLELRARKLVEAAKKAQEDKIK